MLQNYGDAPWWNPSNPQDGRPLVRNAPDDDNYHYPDGRQLERMQSGGGMPIIVPRARQDGRSMAFDPTVAGVVHVDPNAPDGGVIVDLTQVSRQQVNEAVDTSRYPHEVFYKIGISPAMLQMGYSQPTANMRRDTNHVPGYVVPASDSQGRQVWGPPASQQFADYQMAYPMKEGQVLPAAPPLPPSAPMYPLQPQQQPQAVAAQVNGPLPYQAPQLPPQPVHPVQYLQPGGYPYQQPTQPSVYAPAPQPYYAPPPSPPPPPDPNLQNMLGQILQGMQALQGRVQQMEQRPIPLPAASAMPQVTTQTLPVGQHGQQYYAPRSQVRRHKQGDDNPYSANDPNQNPVFEDEPTPIGQRPRRRRRGEEQSEQQSEEPQQHRQHLSDLVDEDDNAHRDGMIVGFESLKLPYVTGPIGLKPRRRVYFEYARGGKFSASYHEVVVNRGSIMLVYDTRYEDGQQYEPEDMSARPGNEDADPASQIIQLHVVHLKKTFPVVSAGLSGPLGCFDVVVLPLADQPEELDYEEDK